MKQLLFLLLFPCLCMAQYTGNGNQKISLGEQTTADGLVFRGLAADTTRKPSVDTMAYILLDTNTNIIWQYKKATNNAWTRLNLLPSDTTSIKYVNTYGTQTVNGAKTFTSAVTATKLNVTDSIQSNSGIYKINSSTLGLNVDNETPFRITNSGNWGIYNDNPQNLLSTFSSSARGGVISGSYPILMFNEVNKSKFIFGLDENEGYLWGMTNVKLIIATNNTEKMRIETNGAVTIKDLAGTGSRAVLADANGVLSAPVSSITTKENVQTLNYGLNEILQINPVSFDYINKDKWGDERNLGFIVEDMFPVVPEVTGTMNNGDMYLDMTKLIPILTKAIQEQQALIKSLEQRILTLENK